MKDKNELKTVYIGKHLTMLTQGRWEYVTRNTQKPAVGIVAVTDTGDVVLVEQYRLPVDCNVIELPAGLAGDIAGLEEEPLVEAAKRELFEETGYKAKHWTELASSFSTPGLTDEEAVLFLAEGLEKIGPGGGDESENITVHEVSLSDVVQWLKKKQARTNLKLYAGLFVAEKYIKQREQKNE